MATAPAGWYPAPHENNQMRYWDGTQWLAGPPVRSSPPPYEGPITSPMAGPAPQAMPQAANIATNAMPRAKAPAGQLAVAALVLGIAGFLTGLIPWLGLLLGISAVALGVVALARRQSKPFAITGGSLGAVAALTGLIVAISVGMSANSTQTTAGGGPVPAQSDPPAAVAPTSPAQDETPDAATDPADNTEDDEEPQEQVEQEPDGSATNPLSQPYIAEGIFGGDKYELRGKIVDADAGDALADWNMFNDAAPKGFKYVVVELTMTGIDPDGVEPSLAEFDLSLATSEGNRYSSETVAFGDDMPSMWEGPTLYPGSSFTGYSAYVVPVDADSFMLHDNGKYISF